MNPVVAYLARDQWVVGGSLLSWLRTHIPKRIPCIQEFARVKLKALQAEIRAGEYVLRLAVTKHERRNVRRRLKEAHMMLRDLLAAPAGPEVDAAVATRVMGWHKKDDSIREKSHWWSEVSGRMWAVRDQGEYEEAEEGWHPSVDMGRAWHDVFQRVMAQKHDVQQAFMTYLQAQANDHRDGFTQSGPWLLKALKDTLPLAICRAALWAMATEQERKEAL